MHSPVFAFVVAYLVVLQILFLVIFNANKKLKSEVASLEEQLKNHQDTNQQHQESIDLAFKQVENLAVNSYLQYELLKSHLNGDQQNKLLAKKYLDQLAKGELKALPLTLVDIDPANDADANADSQTEITKQDQEEVAQEVTQEIPLSTKEATTDHSVKVPSDKTVSQ